MALRFTYMRTDGPVSSPTWRAGEPSARLSIPTLLCYGSFREAALCSGLRIAGQIFGLCEPRRLHWSGSWGVGVYTPQAPIRHVLHAINQKKRTISIYPCMASAEFFGNLQHLKKHLDSSSQLKGWANYHTDFQSTAGLRPT